jgi:hypothetical protein
LEPVPSKKETDTANDMAALAKVVDFMMDNDKDIHVA